MSSSTESTSNRRSSPKVVIDNTGGAHTSKKSSGQTPPTGGTDPSNKPADNIAVAGDPPSGSTTAGPAETPAPEPESTTAAPQAPAAATAALGGPTTGSQRPQRSSHTPQEPPAAPVGAPRAEATVTATAGPAPSRPPVQARADAVVDRPAAPPPGPALPAPLSPRSPAAVSAAEVVSAAPEDPTPPGPAVSKVVLAGLALAGLDPLGTDSPTAPLDSPMGLALAAWGTRPGQSGQAVTGQARSGSDDPMLTSQSVDTTAAVQALAAEPMTATTTTSSTTTTFAQVKAAAPQTQQSGRGSGGDTLAPTVSITAPAGGATVSGTVTLRATASDNVKVTGVQFLLDGTNLGVEDTNSPYTVSWNTTQASNGTHLLTAVARDAAGNKATSAPVSVTVNNPDTQAPTVNLTAPAAGATVSGTAVALSANASDNVGVAGVQFLLNGAPLGAEDTTTPYGVSWNTTGVTNGTYTLTAQARDAAGNKTTSAPVSVTVNNLDTQAPTVNLTAPAPNATVSGTVPVSAAATDNVGVTGVQFLLNGAPLGAEDTSSGYGVSWDTTTVANGTYTLTAQARDAASNKTTSAPVTVTVNNAAPSPAPLSGTTMSINVGSHPNGVAVVGNRAYVANGASDTVSVVDVNTTQIVATIPVDHTPTYVVARPDGTRVYVSNANSATVSVIDTTSNRLIRSVGVYGGAYAQIPGGLAISPDGTKLYVSTFDGTVSLIDTTTNTWTGLKFIRPGITNLEVSADGERLYIADTQRGVILAVDTAKLVGPTSGIPDIPEIGIRYDTTPVDVAVSRDGRWLYSVNVVGGSHSSVSVIDADPTSPTYSRVVRTLTVDDNAAFVALSPDGSRAYVTHQEPGTVTVIDTKLNLVLGTVPTDRETVASDAYVAVGSDGRVYVTDSDDNRIHITTVSGGILPTVPVSVTPISVGTSPIGVAVNGNRAYVYGNGTVSVINTATKQVTGTTAVYSDPSTATLPDGTRRYEVNGRSVSVINTATNAVVANVEIPVCPDCYYWPGGLYGVEVSPNGTRVYVRENYVTETGGTTVVSVIDATTNTLIGTGYPPLLNDIDATPDGRLYAADMQIPAVYVFDENMNGIATISVFPGTWYSFVDTLAVNTNGTRTYAVVRSWDVGFHHVSVIDSDPGSSAYNTEVARIRQQDTAVSPDGSRTYVLGSDGRSVAVIDTATNSLIGRFTTDLTSGSTTRSIAIGPDGALYISDSADNKVYAITVGATTV